jgi:hypothetical protein
MQKIGHEAVVVTPHVKGLGWATTRVGPTSIGGEKLDGETWSERPYPYKTMGTGGGLTRPYRMARVEIGMGYDEDGKLELEDF